MIKFTKSINMSGYHGVIIFYVLCFSVNRIRTLADFEHCKKLQHLFVRKNDIRDLNQVCYLRDLPALKSLWLAENPCAGGSG